MHKYLLIIFYTLSIISFNYQSEVFVSQLNVKKIIGQSRAILKKEEFPILVINKISFKENIYPIGDSRNHIDKNLELLYADYEKHNYIIVAHSGTGKAAYFKNLNKLEKDDLVTIQGKTTIKYKVFSKYLIKKAKQNSLKLSNKTGNLQLITCDRKEKDKFLVVELSLQK